jgi:hypothetical protein
MEKEPTLNFLDANGKEIKIGNDVRLSEKVREEYLSGLDFKGNESELELEKNSMVEFRGIVESFNPDGTVTLRSANVNNKVRIEIDPINLVIE